MPFWLASNIEHSACGKNLCVLFVDILMFTLQDSRAYHIFIPSDVLKIPHIRLTGCASGVLADFRVKL